MPDQNRPVTVGRYLWTRLRQIGVDSVHGVPGDYNLNLLDSISSEGLRWVGNCNELNAGRWRSVRIENIVTDKTTGYAADGYARVKGIGAMVTTGGVGELSAINAHAGAYSEQAAVIHIVGSPALSIRGNKQFKMHHTLGDDDYDVFKNMFKAVSAEQVTLKDASRASEEIDHILKTCWVSSRPIYIDVPADMANKVVDGSRLSLPLNLKSPPGDTENQYKALEALLGRLAAAQTPCILVDMCATRQRVS